MCTACWRQALRPLRPLRQPACPTPPNLPGAGQACLPALPAGAGQARLDACLPPGSRAGWPVSQHASPLLAGAGRAPTAAVAGWSGEAAVLDTM